MDGILVFAWYFQIRFIAFRKYVGKNVKLVRNGRCNGGNEGFSANKIPIRMIPTDLVS